MCAIRGYYFPRGSKRIPYGRIRAVRQVRLEACIRAHAGAAVGTTAPAPVIM
jgi:hypothetical protein